MPHGLQLPRPIMSATAGLHAHFTRRKLAEKRQQLGPAQRFAHQHLARTIHGMHLDHLLCQIQCNTINLHDGLLLLWDWLINTSSLALRCRISGRSPFHWVQTRALAARVLAAVIGKGRSLKAELGAALPKLDDSRDRALLEAICFAALRRRTIYDQALRQWLQKPLGPR